MSDLGLIVGSGFAKLGLAIESEEDVATPFGAPSSTILAARIGAVRLQAVVRHGKDGRIAPHRVNYRANVWALHTRGVRRCVAVNLVGAIDPALGPGDLAVPDQLIDYTWGREATFAEPDQPVTHIEFTEPFDPVLRGALADATATCGFGVHRGVYGVTQGPRLETAAEIDRLERDGCSLVGMTAMPEAALAREVGMAYAICAVVVNAAAGRSPAGLSIHAELERSVAVGMARAGTVLENAISALERLTM